jgi:hypothetical protein
LRKCARGRPSTTTDAVATGVELYDLAVRQQADRIDTTEVWFTMQIAMVCGSVTSYPMNRWL